MSSFKKFASRDLTFSFLRPGLTDIALFSKHLSVMIHSGIPLAEALQISQDSAPSRLQRIAKEVAQSAEAGQSLSTAFARYPGVFSKLFLGAVYAGERSGTLEASLDELAQQLEKERELVAKIRGAFLYPTIILSAAFVLGLLFMFLILPKLTALLLGLHVKLPFTTQLLVNLSSIVQEIGHILLIIIVTVLLFSVWVLRQEFMKPLSHWIFLHLPVIKRLSRSANLARFCRTLGTLLKSGVHIDEALLIVKETVSNHYYQKALATVAPRVTKGTKLSENLSLFPHLFPVLVTRMVRVGEESGRMEETLFYLANFYEVEVDVSTKSLSSTIEPILLLIVGLAVAFLALSIITPIFEITGGIGRSGP